MGDMGAGLVNPPPATKKGWSGAKDNLLDTGGNFFCGIQATAKLDGLLYGISAYVMFFCDSIPRWRLAFFNLMIFIRLFLRVLVFCWSANRFTSCLILFMNQFRKSDFIDISPGTLFPAHPSDSRPLA